MTTEIFTKNLFNELQTCTEKQAEELTNDLIMNIKNGTIEIETLLSVIDVLIFYGKKHDVLYNVNIFKNIFDDTCDTENGRILIRGIYDHIIRCLTSKYKSVRKNSIIFMDCMTQYVTLTNDMLIEISKLLFDRENEVVKEAIFFMKDHQNLKISKKDHIYDIFVNFLRHNADSRIRKEILKHLNINEKTAIYAAEKVNDEDYNVRKYFYENILHKIDFKCLKKEVVTFVIEKIFEEREFDYKKNIFEIIVDQFDLRKNVNNIFTIFKGLNQKELLQYFVSEGLLDYSSLPKNTLEAKILYEYISSDDGSELALLNTSNYNELINNALKNEYIEIDYINLLMKILEASVINNPEIIISTFFNVVEKAKDENIVDTVFMIINRLILTGEDLSKIITNFAISFPDITPLILKCVAKYCKSHPEICKGLLDTYYSVYAENIHYLQALLYYLQSNLDQKYIQLIVESRKTNYITDLYLTSKKYVEFIFLESIIYETISEDPAKAIEPIIKILISNGNGHKDFFIYIVQAYFEELDDYNKQLISTYLLNSIASDPYVLINSFEKLFNTIDDKKMFVNQSMFWIKNNKSQKASQDMFYSICCILLRNDYNKQHLSILLHALHQFNISEDWHREVIKKILYCCSKIFKKLENKSLMNEIIGNLMTIDDGEPISQELVEIVKKDTTND